MKFSELLNLKFDSAGNIIESEIKRCCPHIPDDVIEQLLAPHGRKEDFQLQYENLELNKITWNEIKVSGNDLISCGIYSDFVRWVNSVSKRVNCFNKDGWCCIDSRIEVVDYWKINNTWKSKPIFIKGSLINENAFLRLVEGHTRIGTLIGLIRKNIIQADKLHKIWFGNL